jgi:CarD family transcriptional regulator
MGRAEKEKTNERNNGGIKYECGDKVFYPGYGVVEIIDVYSRHLGEIRGNTLLYSCRVLESGLQFSVPAQNVDVLGVRPLISEADILRIFTILKERRSTCHLVSLRPDDYERLHGQIRSASSVELAKVLGDLYVLGIRGALSFAGQRMLTKVRDVIVTEIVEASGRNKEQVVAQIREIFD